MLRSNLDLSDSVLDILQLKCSINGCPLLRVCVHGVCVFTAVCVHFGWVKYRAQIPCMSLSLSVALYTVKKKKTLLKKKRVSFNPYKDIYYCQPLKI